MDSSELISLLAGEGHTIANHSVERTGASRSGQLQFVRQWWLAPAAHAGR